MNENIKPRQSETIASSTSTSLCALYPVAVEPRLLRVVVQHWFWSLVMLIDGTSLGPRSVRLWPSAGGHCVQLSCLRVTAHLSLPCLAKIFLRHVWNRMCRFTESFLSMKQHALAYQITTVRFRNRKLLCCFEKSDNIEELLLLLGFLLRSKKSFRKKEPASR